MICLFYSCTILGFFPTGLRPHFDFSCQSHTYCKPHNETLTVSHSLVAHWGPAHGWESRNADRKHAVKMFSLTLL